MQVVLLIKLSLYKVELVSCPCDRSCCTSLSGCVRPVNGWKMNTADPLCTLGFLFEQKEQYIPLGFSHVWFCT